MPAHKMVENGQFTSPRQHSKETIEKMRRAAAARTKNAKRPSAPRPLATVGAQKKAKP